MRRIQYNRYGGPEELKLAEFDLPPPGRGQVCVRVKAAGVNPMDWKIRDGAMKIMTGSRFPRGLGHDFAGVVEAVGPEVQRLKVGDAVLGATGMKEAGAFADALIAEEKYAFAKPSSLSFGAAGSLTVVSVTAWTALIDKAKLSAGQSVFIAGCLGSVGRAAVQIALMRGATVSGSCSASRHGEARALGVSEVADYRGFKSTRFKRRFDVVFDTQGALSLGECGAMTKRGGVALHIAAAPLKMLRILLSPRHKLVFADPKPAIMAGVIGAVEQGHLMPEIGETVPLSDAIPAIVKLEKTGVPKGKLVIVPEG